MELLQLIMSEPPPVPPRPGLPLEAQDSVTPSEDWGSEDEGDYQNYYGEDDIDVDLIASGKAGPAQFLAPRPCYGEENMDMDL